MNNLPPPSAFTIDQNDPNKWPKWRKKFENYIITSDLDSKTIQQQRAILLHIIGDSALGIYITFGFEENAQSPTIKDILDKYDQYFRPFKNTIYRRYIFFTCEQKLNQTFDDFVTEINSKAEDCEFENIKDSLIRDRIVLGCRDTTLREKYLQNPDLTLSLAINQGQAAEASQKQLRNIEKDSIDAIRKNFNEKYKPTTSLRNSYTSNPVRANFNKLIRCSKCNMAYDFAKCPAYGKECYKCRQPNHFTNCCKNRAVRCIQEIEEEKDNLLIIDSIMVGQVLRKPWKELIYIQRHPVDVKLDTGADVNILPERLIKEWPNMPLLETADCKIYTCTGQQIPVVGKCQLDCKTKYACRKVTFLIVNNSAVPILGLDECVNLNLVKRVETISEISVTLTGLLDEYKDVFKGNGYLSYIYDIKISDKAEPKISPARRLPRALLQPVKEELFKMEEDGIIEKIEEPTVWAHPMVVVKKPSGKYRICIDPRELNKWVLREHYTLPAPENILAEIPKAKFYSVLDAKSAFWQVPLNHNSSLKKVSDLARESRLKLTLNKLQMATGVVKFLGHTISQEGISLKTHLFSSLGNALGSLLAGLILGSALSDKIRAIQNMQIPKNKQELQRTLGTVTHLAKFIPDLSSNTSNMKNLLKKDIIWNWNIAADQELNFIKTLLTSPPVLRHFDPNEPLELFADASKDGRLKRTFSNFGIPETLVSDNGPPFFSKEFQNFTRTWNIVHVTSSPYHAQSIGMVKRTVQTLKKLLKRCREESTDPYLALLNLRNTPHKKLPSPAQILMSRKLRSIIPSKTSQFVPSMINNEAIQKQLVDNQVKMKTYYDRHTRPADPLSIKDRVWFQKDKRWIPGQITNQAHEPRSFYVKDQEGNEYRRNSIHIREDKRNETTHTDWEKPLELSQEQDNLQDLEESTSQHSTQPTSSGQLSSPGSPKNVTTTGPPENWTNGSPKNLITTRSGRGAPAFTSEKFRKSLITHGIQPLLTTSNNPQANGLIERLNATITGKLRLAYLENPKASWTQLVKRINQAYNNTPHSVTSFPPTYLMFNVVPPDLRTHLNPYPEITRVREIARSRTQYKHKKDEETFDKQHRTPHFEVNDLVLVKNYRHPDTGKLAPYFTGPYTIIEIISPNVVRIDRLNQPLNRDSDTIHVNKLKYYTENFLYITPPQTRFV
ncbi:K02A2.6-like [Cordylochernes scorpioides]|uniref:K02A2.6-like n=1 Tax=Cordylochernes scorpioides TaxID=51811 RepID=A0ABY6KED8_9ARAC|nr:K02A2.6-like [Cordylochernes scorpioides]